MAGLEVGEGVGVVRTGDDDERDEWADFGVVDELFEGALEDGPAAQVFVELGAWGASIGVVSAGGSGGGDEEGDLHAQR